MKQKQDKQIWIDHCMQLQGAYEDYPFDEDPMYEGSWTTMRHRGNGKTFALIYRRDGLKLNLKCEPLRGEFLCKVYEGITPGYHMNKRHWITVRTDSDVQKAAIEDLIYQSYLLTAPKRPKKKGETDEF